MSKNTFKLYIDELGMSHPKSYASSPYYILLGCIIDENSHHELSNQADHIKFKYWGRTNIVFHSIELARDLNDFAIFRNDLKRKQEFISDLFELLSSAPIKITAAVIDKQKAHLSSWEEKKSIRVAAQVVFKNFLALIYTRRPCRGHVVIEASSAYRDTIYLEEFNKLLTPKFFNKNPQFQNVRDHLTSINFVTKQNHDIEAQIADLIAYGVRCKLNTGQSYTKKSYEAKIIKIVDTKLIQTPANVGQEKLAFYQLITPVNTQPKRRAPRKKKP